LRVNAGAFSPTFSPVFSCGGGPVAAGYASAVGEGVPLDELHRQKRAAVGQRPDLEEGRDARVLELGGDAGLGDEPGGGLVAAQPVVEDLDGHVAADRRLVGPVNDAHPAAGQFLADAEPADGVFPPPPVSRRRRR
jgi:hypothetical protein